MKINYDAGQGFTITTDDDRILVNQPGNPTGQTWTDAERTAFAENMFNNMVLETYTKPLKTFVKRHYTNALKVPFQTTYGTNSTSITIDSGWASLERLLTCYNIETIKGSTTFDLYDVNNVAQTVTMTEFQEILTNFSNYLSSLMDLKNNTYTTIDGITTDAVALGLTVYDDFKALTPNLVDLPYGVKEILEGYAPLQEDPSQF